MNEQKRQIAYACGTDIALTDPFRYMKHLARQAGEPNLHNRKAWEKQGFFDTLGLVDDEQESSIMAKGREAWIRDKMVAFDKCISNANKEADDIEYVQNELTSFWKGMYPELVGAIDKYWENIEKEIDNL